MNTYIDNAKKEENKAESKLKGSFFSNMFKNKNERYDEAIECFKKSINFYKLAKNYEKAAEISRKCGKLSKEIKENYDSGNFFNESADLYKKSNRIDKAIEIYAESIEILKIDGRYSQAAKISQNLAEIYEEKNEFDLSITYYVEAFELFQMEKHHTSDSLKCKNKIGEIKCHNLDNKEKLKEAIKDYEYILNEYLSNNLLKYNAKTYLINIVLICILLDDSIGAEKYFNIYCDKDFGLKNSYEGKFLTQLIEATKDREFEKIDQIYMEVQKYITLDKIKTKFFLKIKNFKNNENLNNDNPENDEFNPF